MDAIVVCVKTDPTANAKRHFIDAVLDLLESQDAICAERYLAASRALDNLREAALIDPAATAKRADERRGDPS